MSCPLPRTCAVYVPAPYTLSHCEVMGGGTGTLTVCLGAGSVRIRVPVTFFVGHDAGDCQRSRRMRGEPGDIHRSGRLGGERTLYGIEAAVGGTTESNDKGRERSKTDRFQVHRITSSGPAHRS